MKKFFVTATGTEIGKTFVTSALCRELIADGKKVVALKPVISGYVAGDTGSDCALILQACGKEVSEENIAKISPWRFAAPLSPDMAARKEGKTIPFAELVKFCKEQEQADADVLLIEGVGGVCVPLDDRHMVLEWITALNSITSLRGGKADVAIHNNKDWIASPSARNDNYKIILVAGSYLGSISHTLTAVRTLVAEQRQPHMIIVNESENSSVLLKDTIETLKNFLPESIRIIGMPRHQVPELKEFL